MHGYFGEMGGWFFWMFLVVIVVLFATRFFSSNGCGFAPHKETPEEILKRRYAEGKISKEEYEETKKNL